MDLLFYLKEDDLYQIVSINVTLWMDSVKPNEPLDTADSELEKKLITSLNLKKDFQSF